MIYLAFDPVINYGVGPLLINPELLSEIVDPGDGRVTIKLKTGFAFEAYGSHSEFAKISEKISDVLVNSQFNI